VDKFRFAAFILGFASALLISGKVVVSDKISEYPRLWPES